MMLLKSVWIYIINLIRHFSHLLLGYFYSCVYIYFICLWMVRGTTETNNNNNNSNRFQIHGKTWTVKERERKKIRWTKHKGFLFSSFFSSLYIYFISTFLFRGFFFGCFLNAKETSKNYGKRSNNFQKKEQQK